MIFVADRNANNINTLAVEGSAFNSLKTVVICGSCGAQELAIDESKTECPHCDEYIY